MYYLPVGTEKFRFSMVRPGPLDLHMQVQRPGGLVAGSLMLIHTQSCKFINIVFSLEDDKQDTQYWDGDEQRTSDKGYRKSSQPGGPCKETGNASTSLDVSVAFCLSFEWEEGLGGRSSAIAPKSA